MRRMLALPIVALVALVAASVGNAGREQQTLTCGGLGTITVTVTTTTNDHSVAWGVGTVSNRLHGIPVSFSGTTTDLTTGMETRDIPVVFLTARADTADKRLGEHLGGVGYLVKPFDPVAIGDYVEDVLSRIERGEREQLRREISSGRER